MSTDTAFVVKDVTDELLEHGSFRFTPTEREKLTLPAHTADVQVRLDGAVVTAHWLGREGRLQGEALLELLQDYATVGQHARLVRAADLIDLHLSDVRDASAFQPRPPRLEDQTRPAVAAPQRTARRQLRQRLHAQRVKFKGRDEYRWHGRVGIHAPTQDRFLAQVRAGGWDEEAFLRLRLEGERLAALDDLDELLAVDLCNVEPYPWQLAAARTVLTRMGGRGIFADEVGLGKTIEAGLVIKELVLRGLADHIMVICPATLREQWRAELEEKFGETFTVATGASALGTALKAQPRRVILSIELARSNRRYIHDLTWDLLVVDEAHRLTGKGANVTRETIEGIEARRMLFLSATPVQNRLDELYRLVELLRPGTFASAREFKARFVSGSDERRPSRPQELRELVSSVMVRTTRTQAGLDNVKRFATDHAIPLGRDEAALYRVCTDMLRHHMNGDGDVVRRRVLAQRLVASPRSLAKSAFRMADAYPDPAVAGLLREIGHRAADLETTQRSTVASEIISAWVREHGRVLVFSQHTDTVEGLMAALDKAGVASVPFHGGMAVGARAKSVKAFRDGQVPVMISTDAGAEGQNLQFCNCVVNYDLPWNPMRIEQRIGRVHRVTQTRDVHVANLFSAGTVDAGVYRLLHEKLAMFELLFGQVTTILGELDTKGGDQTFEGAVLDAYLSGDDTEMQRRMDAYGERLRAAREKALASIELERHAGLDEWVAPPDVESTRFEHRSQIDEAKATELTPQQYEMRRERQTRLERFVRGFLDLIGAEVTHEVGSEAEGAFLSANLPPDWADELDRDFLHLAFDPAGLAHHPDAELCAVGADVFEEILEALRLEGDLFATVPVQQIDTDASPLAAASDVTFVERHLEPARSWHADATWLVRSNLPDQPERIETVSLGEPCEGHDRTPLGAGDDIEDAVGDVTALLSGVEEAAAAEFDALAEQYLDQVVADRRREVDRIVSHYEARLAEVDARLDAARRGDPARYGWQEERSDYELALKSFRDQAEVRPEVDVRAELLALRVDAGDDAEVVETWVSATGHMVTLRYPYADEGAAESVRGDDGGLVGIVAICDGGHVVDVDGRYRCPVCDCHACVACGSRSECRICAALMCPSCTTRSGLAGICHRCAAWERAPELHDGMRRAVRLGSGDVLVVGERHCEWRAPNGSKRLLVVDADIDDPARATMRAVARARGLPPDLGACALPDLGAAPDRGRILWIDEDVTDEVEVVAGGGSAIAPETLTVVEGLTATASATPDFDVESEDAAGIGELLTMIRAELDVPAGPALAVKRVIDRTWVDVGADGLTHRRQRTDADTATELESSHGPWRVPTAAEASVLCQGWDVTPEACLVANVGGSGAAVVRIGEHRMLAVWREGRIGQWWTLHEDLDDISRALLGVKVADDPAALMDVCVWSRPRDALSTRIEGADVSIGLEPTFGAPTSVSALTYPLKVLAAWVPDATPAGAVTPAQPTPLSTVTIRSILDVADGVPTRWHRVVYDVGMEVTYEISAGTDHQQRSVACAPGTQDARLACDVTGQAEDVLHLDSTGHLVARTRTCRYCDRTVCERCPDPMTACKACRIALCGRCAGAAGLCRACTGASRISRKEAKQRGADPKLFKRAVAGNDELHEVVCTEAETGWTVLRIGRSGTKTSTVPAESPAAAHLDHAAGRS